nr:hypothetical protein [Lachnospiraceae bacterium]
ANMYYSTYYGQTGPYTNIFSNYMLSYYTNDPWGEITREGRDDHYVFRGQNTEPLKLEDVFVPGADIRALLKKAFEANALGSEGDWVPNNYATTKEQRNGYFDAVLDYGLDFTIGSDRLYFYINEGAADLFIHQNIGEGLNQYALRNLISYAMYKDLGMDNLSIF